MGLGLRVPYIKSMGIQFEKMHGSGNDFVIMDLRDDGFSLIIEERRAICDRHVGIGCDQLVTIHAPLDKDADAFIRFYNRDGTEAGACGNASRCAADFLYRQYGDLAPVLQTCSGLLATRILHSGTVEVDMGKPITDWRKIPLSKMVDTLALPLPGHPAVVSMGNPHITLFVEHLVTYPVENEGIMYQNQDLFPEGVNVGFAEVIAQDGLRLKVYERGSGLTKACGSGACAAVVNAIRTARLKGPKCQVYMDGGNIDIVWDERRHVLMTGKTAYVFSGVWPLNTVQHA